MILEYPFGRSGFEYEVDLKEFLLEAFNPTELKEIALEYVTEEEAEGLDSTDLVDVILSYGFEDDFRDEMYDHYYETAQNAYDYQHNEFGDSGMSRSDFI